jgi:hypothetical protein
VGFAAAGSPTTRLLPGYSLQENAMTETDILRRCCEHPTAHLAEPTISQFMAYSLGYEWHKGLEAENLDRVAFREAVKTDYHVEGDWPINVATTGYLEAVEGPSGALSKYLHYRDRLASPNSMQQPARSSGDLFEFLDSKDGFRKLPAMYFGNDTAAAHIWSMLSGYRWAETDSASSPAHASVFLARFQDWVEHRFPFSRGIPWHRTFYFVSVSSSALSLHTFFDHFDLFRAGEPPDCLSQTARTIISTIVDGSGCDPSSIEHIARKIAPI